MTDFERIGEDIDKLKSEIEELEPKIAPDGGETVLPL